ncbi:MAG: hypothetical protein HC887_08035 [Desulfobacteraceae bacterium]|nr:hypothetical protein [Desulfobacteraceae bacterium]
MKNVKPFVADVPFFSGDRDFDLSRDLAQEEQELSRYFTPESWQGFRSEHNAFEAAQELKTLGLSKTY